MNALCVSNLLNKSNNYKSSITNKLNNIVLYTAPSKTLILDMFLRLVFSTMLFKVLDTIETLFQETR